MKKIFLTKFKATNVAGFKSIEFTPKKDNVYITGQNGAGKYTIKKAISWVLSAFGSTVDGEKLITYDGVDMPFVEIQLSDDAVCTNLAKKMVRRVSNGKTSCTTNCFFNGLPAIQKEVNKFFRVPILTYRYSFFKGGYKV